MQWQVVVRHKLYGNKPTFPIAIADEAAALDETPETPLTPPVMPTALSTAISVRTKEER